MTLRPTRAVLLSVIILISVFSIAGTGLSGATTASSDASNVIQGEITYEDGQNASDWKVLASNGAMEPPVDYTDSSGAFAVNVSSNDSYNVWYQQYNVNNPRSANFPRDGKVDMWALGTVDTNFDEDIGARTIPNGSLLKVKVVDKSGNPISNASVDVSLNANGARASSGGETNANGQMVLHGNDVPGIEVTGAVDVNVFGVASYSNNHSTVSVSSNRTFTVVLAEEVGVNGTVLAADGSAADNDTVVFKNREVDSYRSSRTDGTGIYSLGVQPGHTYERAFYSDSQKKFVF